MSIVLLKRIIVFMLFSVSVTLISCGNSGKGQSLVDNEAETGNVSFDIVFASHPNIVRSGRSKSFSSCHDIDRVVATVYDQSGSFLRRGEWDCGDGHGEMTGIRAGINRLIIIQGIRNNDHEEPVVFYRGQKEGIEIEIGTTTHVEFIEVDFVAPEMSDRADQDNDKVTTLEGDCDDLNPSIHPYATELCNNIDDDCNGLIDDGAESCEEPPEIYYEDSDEDGFGNPDRSVIGAVPGYVTDNTDCDDTSAQINPDATEICNGIDDNCNNMVDDGLGTDECVLLEFNATYTNVTERVPDEGTTYSDIHISAAASVEKLTSYSDFSDPEHGFENTYLPIKLSNTRLSGGPFPVSHDWSGLDRISLETSYTVSDFGDMVSMSRDARIVSVDKSPASVAPFYQLGNVQIVHDLTTIEYNHMRQLLLNEDALSFINQFMAMNPQITTFSAYRYDELPGGWSAWWECSQQSFSIE